MPPGLNAAMRSFRLAGTKELNVMRVSIYGMPQKEAISGCIVKSKYHSCTRLAAHIKHCRQYRIPIRLDIHHRIECPALEKKIDSTGGFS